MENDEISYMSALATLKYGSSENWRSIADKATKQQKENTMAEKKLFQIRISNATVAYGHKLAVDSTGKWVMELKGTGEVRSFDKTLIEEVMPFTVAIQFQTNKQVYHYLANKDQAELNAFYIFDSALGRSIAQVVELDTKSAAATVEFKPLAKLSVTSI
jgi:hypothetical protein